MIRRCVNVTNSVLMIHSPRNRRHDISTHVLSVHPTNRLLWQSVPVIVLHLYDPFRYFRLPLFRCRCFVKCDMTSTSFYVHCDIISNLFLSKMWTFCHMFLEVFSLICIYLGWGGLFANLWQPSKFYVGMFFFCGRTTCPPLTQNVKISQQTNRWADTWVEMSRCWLVGGRIVKAA